MLSISAARPYPVAGKWHQEDLPAVAELLEKWSELLHQALDCSLVRHHQGAVDVVGTLPVLPWQTLLPARIANHVHTAVEQLKNNTGNVPVDRGSRGGYPGHHGFYSVLANATNNQALSGP
jgi:hypothetical protein